MLLPFENLIVFVLGVICEFYSWHCHLEGLLRILWCVEKLFERCHSGIEWRITIMDVLIMSFMLSTTYVQVTSESEHMTITIVWSTVLLFFLDNVPIHYIVSMNNEMGTCSYYWKCTSFHFSKTRCWSYSSLKDEIENMD